ncbi:hypothetical protein CI105_02355 [Candidatus Izimaplasma bacterium ZiA1]|uniref:winged helix-turn-helix domain-containing protein n=1 Tax=Candidatus Izimoplasma sp. ZiA1 TaxID=2024899 RepID=UPI000BAA683B|nr:hypothetical protein CI105_02355 [Candidatus Izimaplasma bacterium ZiA1]
MARNERVISTDEEIKIFSDPYRMKIIEVFLDSDEPITAKKVADIMGEVPAKVHYHVQKLLKIKIIELDHIKVINGINAKYYKLVNDRFSVEFKKDGSLNSQLQRLSKVQNVLVSHIESFKDEVLSATEGFKDIEKDTEFGGMFYRKNLYLTIEEAKEIQDMMEEIIEKYSTNKENKSRFSMLLGVIRNESKDTSK